MTAVARRNVVAYDLTEPNTQGLSSSVPITFELDGKGSVAGRYSGYPVYVDRNSNMEVNAGDTFFVRLKDKTVESGCFFAVPVKPVDADFFVELCTDDKMQFLRSVFMAGGKPADALIDAIVRSSPEICGSLERSSDIIQRNIDSSNAASMYKTKLDNANETIRRKDGEIAKLKERISAKETDGETRREDMRALKKTVSELEARVVELTEALSATERERDDIRGESEGKDCLIGSLGDRISELTRSEPQPSAGGPRPAFTVRRDSEATISSDWFTDQRYRVMMSGDTTRLLITPDPEGEVLCEGYALRIPRLATVRPFSGMTYLRTVFSSDMGSLEVVL